MAELVTTLGRKRADEIGMMLPHEHIFVDLRIPGTPGYAEGEPADVVTLMQPEIEKIKAQGTTWDPLESTCRHASLSIL